MGGMGILLVAFGAGGLIASVIWSFDIGHYAPTLFSTWTIPIWGTVTLSGALILLLKRPMELDDGESLVSISVLENDVEASVLDAALEEAGIPHLMKSYHDSAYDGIYQSQHGWGEVLGPQSQANRILEILMDLRNEASFVI
jgi:hypothetical protein